MSLAQFLGISFAGEPAFLKESWIQGVPVRHLFMAGTVWKLAESQPRRPLRILEIGSWMGSSALTWGEALHRFAHGQGELVCVDPLVPYFDAEANKAALDPANAATRAGQAQLIDEMAALLAADMVYPILKHNVGTIMPPVRVTVERRTAAEFLPTLADSSFDIVYVDGDHSYDAARFDIGQALRLARDGGVVCGDDLEAQLHEVDEAFARAHCHLDFPTDPRSGRQFHPGVTLAVGEALGAVTEYSGYWLMRKAGLGFEPCPLDGLPLMIPGHFPSKVRDAIIAQLRG